MTIIILLVALAGFIYFALRWIQLRKGYQALSRNERNRAEILAKREEDKKVPLKDRLQAELVKQGLGESLYPLYSGFFLMYLAVAAPMTLLGVPNFLGLLIAIPLSAVVAWGGVKFYARRKRSKFNKQLVDLFDMVLGQIKAGTGAERALQIVVPQLPDPLKEEMLLTLAAGRAGRDLVGSMRELAKRYPSRAMEMFIAALEIDRAEGQAIAPALEQASDLLKKDFALSSEANAEISQTKYEFYAVAAIIGTIGLYMIFLTDYDGGNPYFTFGGLIVVALAIGNIALGTWRFNRFVGKIKGDTQ